MGARAVCVRGDLYLTHARGWGQTIGGGGYGVEYVSQMKLTLINGTC